jgi:hypothetical protein
MRVDLAQSILELLDAVKCWHASLGIVINEYAYTCEKYWSMHVVEF